MENQKLSRELTAIETRTMIAERNAGRLALPLDLVERQLYLIRKALAVLSPEDRRNALDLATVIRAECVDETARVRRRYQAGEDRPVDPDDRAARRQYFCDWVSDALAGMDHESAAALVREVNGT